MASPSPTKRQAIRATPPSPRTGDHEITDVLQTLVDSGPGLRSLWFDGTYININTPADLDAVRAACAAPEAPPAAVAQGNE